MKLGKYRRVFLFRSFVLKLPRMNNLLRGMRCNRWEHEMWVIWQPVFRWATLCPVTWADVFGILVIMPRACEDVTEQEAIDADDREKISTTAEGKPADYGRLNGCVVAIDYGLAYQQTVRERRCEYRQKARAI